MIFLAPHLIYPPRHGGDIYVERLACHISQFCGETHLLGANDLLTYRNGQLIKQQYYSRGFRSKTVAALRVLAYGSHYYIEKFITPDFKSLTAQLLAEHPSESIVCSYLATTSLLQSLNWQGKSMTLTQNDEITWFEHQFNTLKNPLERMVARLSERWILNFLRKQGMKLTLAHITLEDCLSYENYLPGHQSLIIPAGVDVAPLMPVTENDGKIHLTFAGSLSTHMNHDALQFFRDYFWDLFTTQLPNLEMTVLGSAPSPRVEKLCRKSGWLLLPNLPDKEFRAALTQADFSVLPFPYTTGAKLKLLTSLAAGVPVLATTNMNILPGQNFTPNLYSDEPSVWLTHLKNFAVQGIGDSARQDCYEYACQYSWETITKNFFHKWQEF